MLRLWENDDDGFDAARLARIVGISRGEVERRVKRLEHAGIIELVAYPDAGLPPAYIVTDDAPLEPEGEGEPVPLALAT